MAQIDPLRKRVQREERAERARLRVLDAAEAEFAAEGYEQARMHAIADRAEVALGTLYGYFEGKQELYAAIHKRRLAELFTEVAGGLAGATGQPAMEHGLRALVHYFCARPDYLTMHLREGFAWTSPERLRTEVQREAWSQGYALVVTVFESAMAAGRLQASDAHLAARLAIAMQQVFLARWLEQTPRVAPDTLFADLFATMTRTFTPTHPSPEPRT